MDSSLKYRVMQKLLYPLRKPDYDLKALFEEGHGKGIEIGDVANVLALVPGWADGLAWHWIVRLKDGKYAYITGGCDYSGWGCQDWGTVGVADSIDQAINMASQEENINKPIAQQLLDQLIGKQPFGLREQ